MLQSTGSSPLAEGQQDIPGQRGELQGTAKTVVRTWRYSITWRSLSCSFWRAGKGIEGRQQHPAVGQALKPWPYYVCNSSHCHSRAFVWIQRCQDTKKQDCNFTRWLQESCSIPGQRCPCINAPCRAQACSICHTEHQHPGTGARDVLLTHSQLCSASEGCHTSPLQAGQRQAKETTSCLTSFSPWWLLCNWCKELR